MISVVPTSACRTAYWLSFAPVMALQLFPVASHRLHWYENEIGVVPLHVPLVAVSVCPTCAVPVTVGEFTFVGFTVIAADPLRNDPKSAPIAIAASASTTTPATCARENFVVPCLLLPRADRADPTDVRGEAAV